MKKAERSVIQHIVTGDKTHPPRASIAKQGREAEAARELSHELQGIPVTPWLWERAIALKQGEIRSAWLAAARELEKNDSNQSRGKGGKGLAARISSYVEAMPPMQTERQQIKADLLKRFTSTPEALPDKEAVSSLLVNRSDVDVER